MKPAPTAESPDILRPSTSLWDKLALRVASDTGTAPLPAMETEEIAWQEVAPGIFYKLLSADLRSEQVCMVVRLAPGTHYPPHEHAGKEELHLLAGELWIDERRLRPGEYNRAEAGSADLRVWSETGCTCILITSTADRLT